MAGRELTNTEAMKRVDYRLWFTDKIMNEYLPSFEKRYKLAKNEGEKKYVLDEAGACVLNYALMVYYLYERMPQFRKAIDSDSELRMNFGTMKKWLDARGAKKGADEYVDNAIVTALSS